VRLVLLVLTVVFVLARLRILVELVLLVRVTFMRVLMTVCVVLQLLLPDMFVVVLA